jgi:Fic family protein
MTTREFLVAVSNGTGVNDAVIEKARELLEKHDAQAEKRKASDSKAKVATHERTVAVLGALSAEYATIEDIAVTANVTVGQARSALSSLVRDGLAVKAEAKVGKARKVVYRSADASADEDGAQYLDREVTA